MTERVSGETPEERRRRIQRIKDFYIGTTLDGHPITVVRVYEFSTAPNPRMEIHVGAFDKDGTTVLAHDTLIKPVGWNPDYSWFETLAKGDNNNA